MTGIFNSFRQKSVQILFAYNQETVWIKRSLNMQHKFTIIFILNKLNQITHLTSRRFGAI